MRVGELYDVAQQIIPTITKRMFTVFYNISMEHLSRTLRININETSYTTAEYKALGESAVRVEGVSFGTTPALWDVVNGELILRKEDGGEITVDVGTPVTIKYWGVVNNAISQIDADGNADGVTPETIWEEQDDGYDPDVQICAVYMAMAESASVIGASKEQVESIRYNFKQYIQRLYVKYNSSVIYQAIRQVSF